MGLADDSLLVPERGGGTVALYWLFSRSSLTLHTSRLGRAGACGATGPSLRERMSPRLRMCARGCACARTCARMQTGTWRALHAFKENIAECACHEFLIRCSLPLARNEYW